MKFERKHLKAVAAILFIAAACISAAVSSQIWAAVFGIVGIAILVSYFRPSPGGDASSHDSGRLMDTDDENGYPDGWQKSVGVDSSLPHFHS